jgi:replication-associated recombination protein RarA
MENVEIRYNKRFGKWEGVVDGRVVSRAATEQKVMNSLARKGLSIEVDDRQGSNFDFEQEKVKFSVNERFTFLEHFVKMVARGQSTALFISGPGGLGKTHTVMETLKQCGKTEDTIGEIDGDFIVIKGFTTAKGMYRCLFENNGKIIVFDDADSSFKDVIGINILKGALDSNEKRVISWMAETRSQDDDLPSRFEFTGRVIFISNLPMNKVPQALVSRCTKVSLDMTTEEKVDRIEMVMSEGGFMPNVDHYIKMEVMQFVRENSVKFTDLNVRSVMNLVKIRNSMDQDEAKMFSRVALYSATA